MPQAEPKLRTWANFVKIEHSIFSLPLILAGTVLATRGWPHWSLLLLIVFTAVCGRVVAMGLNRIVDADIDRRNPRTRGRELARGAMNTIEAWVVVAAATLLYGLGAAALGPLCLSLAPIPVALFLLYPFLKRFTLLAHLGLGITWSVAPVAGWVAATGSLRGLGQVGWLWLFSLLWVTGFDIIYATMDETFDRQEGLHSMPAKLGQGRSLVIAAGLHLAAFLALCGLWYYELGTDRALPWLLGVAALFVWQHLVAKRSPEFAFFQLNGVLGFIVFGFVAAGAL